MQSGRSFRWHPFGDVKVAPSTSSSGTPAAQAVDLDVESALAKFQQVEMDAAYMLSQVAIQQATERTQAGLLATFRNLLVEHVQDP